MPDTQPHPSIPVGEAHPVEVAASLKQMLDDGQITDAEYDAACAKITGGATPAPGTSTTPTEPQPAQRAPVAQSAPQGPQTTPQPTQKAPPEPASPAQPTEGADQAKDPFDQWLDQLPPAQSPLTTIG